MYADQINNEARRSIFLKLCKAEFLKYTELKPPEMESNHFAYHLKKLKDDGFVKQDEKTGSYTLAPKGLRLADVLSFKTDLIRTQPKIIILVVAKSKDGSKVLIGTRQRQPYFGRKVFPAGKIHFGEVIYNAEKRTLREFLPNAAPGSMVKKGNVAVIHKKDGICISHIYCHVYEVDLESEEEQLLPKSFENQSSTLKWEPIDEVGKSDEWLEGTGDILKRLSSPDIIDEELVFET